jgi:hypothetical protein
MTTTVSPEYAAKKAAELHAFAAEYERYSTKMPTDPFALRWKLIAEALNFHADHFAAVASASPAEGQPS